MIITQANVGIRALPRLTVPLLKLVFLTRGLSARNQSPAGDALPLRFMPADSFSDQGEGKQKLALIVWNARKEKGAELRLCSVLIIYIVCLKWGAALTSPLCMRHMKELLLDPHRSTEPNKKKHDIKGACLYALHFFERISRGWAIHMI